VMTHGTEALVLASFVGYYARLHVDKDESSKIFREAAKLVIYDNFNLSDNHSTVMLRQIASGDSFKRFNQDSLGLESLIIPSPSQPGTFEEMGGTGTYTKVNELGKLALVFAHFDSPSEQGELRITRTADFCKTDIPVMTKLVCDLSRGEYRADLHNFITTQFPIVKT
ncbi:MAG TPA: hypothetical protein VII94_01895, partial [Candidatus Saccharimonadales bacterium]